MNRRHWLWKQVSIPWEEGLYPASNSSLFHACVMGPESGRDGACINGGTVIKESGEVF